MVYMNTPKCVQEYLRMKNHGEDMVKMVQICEENKDLEDMCEKNKIFLESYKFVL